MGQNPTDPEEAHTPISNTYTHHAAVRTNGAPPSAEPSNINLFLEFKVFHQTKMRDSEN